MNKLCGQVVSVIRGDPYATYEVLLLTGLTIAGISACADDKPSFQAGDAVGVYFDEMDVVLAKYFSEDTTIRKRFTAMVDSVESGEALTRIVLNYDGFPISAVVRTSSWNSLVLDVGSEVLWLIKATKVNVGLP
jgi:molybdopterin-binding protein